MRKLTHEQFMERFYKKNKHAQDIEVVGTYINNSTKILCRCKKDGYEWKVRPHDLLQGTGCPKCGGRVKLTHKEFITKLHQVSSNIEVIGTYVNGDTKIKCKCKIHEYEWSVRPADLLRGHGCPKCGNKRNAQKRTITHEEFIQRLQQVNPNIEILGTYINSQTKIKCKCKMDGYEWSARPAALLYGYGCPKCAGNLKLTHKEFMEKFYEKNKHAQNIEILGDYINTNTKILCRCKIDGYEWQVTPNALLTHNYGCPKCAGKYRTHDEFIKLMKEKQPNIQVLGDYINTNTKILCKCKIDGHEWEPTPSSLLQGTGCPKCAGVVKPTTEEFIAKVKQINSNIDILGTYVNSSTKILCKCKVCGHEWTPTPDSLLQGSGCPKCNISKGEKRIAQYLDNLGIDYTYDKPYFKDLVAVSGSPLRPDFIIPSLKIWIEYDGIQHYEPIDFTGKMSEQQIQSNFKKVQENDQIKNQYAKDNNWTLIRIPYYDYDNIEQILAAYIEQEQVI